MSMETAELGKTRSVARRATSQGPAAAPRRLKVLAPIRHANDALNAARYAQRLQERGQLVVVCLLHVAERIGARQFGLLPRIEPHVKAAEDRGWEILNEATMLLTGQHIPHSSVLRWGEVVFTVLDVAEELACNAIVMPPRDTPFWRRHFSRGITHELICARRGVPVITQR